MNNVTMKLMVTFTLLTVLTAAENKFFEVNELTSTKTKLNFKSGEITPITEGVYTRINSMNDGLTTDEGFPELPVYSTMYHLNPEKNYSVNYTVNSSYVIEDVYLFPVQKTELNKNVQKSFTKNLTFYNRNKKF